MLMEPILQLMIVWLGNHRPSIVAFDGAMGGAVQKIRVGDLFAGVGDNDGRYAVMVGPFLDAGGHFGVVIDVDFSMGDVVPLKNIAGQGREGAKSPTDVHHYLFIHLLFNHLLILLRYLETGNRLILLVGQDNRAARFPGWFALAEIEVAGRVFPGGGMNADAAATEEEDVGKFKDGQRGAFQFPILKAGTRALIEEDDGFPRQIARADHFADDDIDFFKRRRC